MKLTLQTLSQAQKRADELCIKKTGFPWSEICEASLRSFLRNYEGDNINEAVEQAVSEIIPRVASGEFYNRSMNVTKHTKKSADNE